MTDIIITNSKVELKGHLEGHDWAIIDHTVHQLYPDLLGKCQNYYVIKQAEEHKNFNELNKIILFFLEKGITRKDTMVIIGGGATSDIGGLAASLLLRGVNWIVVPTTLLSMVDAAIGGKVAVNTSFGKNLIGSFHSPIKALYFDEFLETLPEEEMQSGLGEVLKYAFLDKNIANYILETDNLLKSNLISLCAKYKTKITQLDFKEADQRKILNLGHTFGHAIETHLRLPHGQAVAYGLWIIIELYAKEYRDEFERFIAKLGINLPPTQIDKQKIIELLHFDKKRDKANTIDVIIPTDIGAEIKQVPMKSLEDKFNEIKFSRYIN